MSVKLSLQCFIHLNVQYTAIEVEQYLSISHIRNRTEINLFKYDQLVNAN